MTKILLIDDDDQIHEIIKHTIADRYELLCASNLGDAEDLLKKYDFSVVLLDEGLPDGKGSDFCFKIKNEFSLECDLSIIMLTVERELKDKLTAFNAGVDDYLTKPFEPLELLARIEVRLREKSGDVAKNLVRGDLYFELQTQNLTIKNEDGERVIDLTPIEFKLLYFLAKRKDMIFSRAQLLDAIWGESKHVVDRTVDQHISKIRKKIKGGQFIIRSSHGLGYSFSKTVK